MPTPAVLRFQLTRTGIHVLLGLVMMLGIGLSLSTSHMVAEVQRASAVLLGHDVPKLERLGAFKSALLQHQAALDNYFAAPARPEHFRQAEVHALRVMRANYLDVVGGMQGTPDQAALEREFARLEGLGAALRSALDGERAGGQARQVLAELNACTNTIRELVDRSRRRVEEEVADSGRTSMDRTSRIATLVHLYIAFALLSAVALFHHVRARMKSEDALAYLARHDQMTRLPHRWAFFERIERLHRQRPAPGEAQAGPQLLVVEADRFDRVVAGIGHPGAEQLVQQLARRVDEVARAIGGEAYRLGDSKFALLLARDVEDAGAQQVAARLQARMAEPVLAGQHEVVLSASIGSAAMPAPGRGALALVQDAETALHQARRRGGAHVAYSRQLDDRVRENLALEAQLRHAAERGELELHYQPQQRLADGQLVGFEALLRWRCAGTAVSPAQFIPLAEESGLIILLGDWVIAEACRQAALWNAGTGGSETQPLTVAVNISPRQFAQPRFVERLHQHLAASGAQPRHVELEITEGVLMERTGQTAALLADIRSLGLKLAIDDFGTGYSSLAYLKRFPVQKLKIDQAFVRHLAASGDDAEIVKAVISLGHNLGFSVIAEGVETAEQAGLLAGWGCDQIQGYHYGRPMPAAQAGAFIGRLIEPGRLVAV
jgi:diguanylate cyclase (GGDEF)-like protein